MPVTKWDMNLRVDRCAEEENNEVHKCELKTPRGGLKKLKV
jgi:hypothetical protein